MPGHKDVLIVGGGHAGAQAAIALRRLKFDGSIGILSEENALPYERPPLTKDYLAGEKTADQLPFKTGAQWADLGVDLRLGQRVVAIDPQSATVATATGDSIGYGKLVWAAGGAPRRLTCAGSDLAGVHTVRSIDDVDRIRARLPEVRQAVIIGGGYIGLEAAAVLTKLGVAVTLLEAQGRLLARVAGPPLSDFYLAEHRAQGVDVRLGAAVDCIEGDGDIVSRVRLADGSTLPADLVIVGIGIDPSIAPLRDAGAETADGVRVDGYCRTSLPGIYAIGDCAEHRNPFAGGNWVRVESVQNAHDQAATVARDICGQGEEYAAVPWFWSNQYDLRLQTVGLSAGFDDWVVRGDPADRSFSIVYLRDGAVIALDCVNLTRDYAQGRQLVARRLKIPVDQLGDPSVALKSLAA